MVRAMNRIAKDNTITKIRNLTSVVRLSPDVVEMLADYRGRKLRAISLDGRQVKVNLKVTVALVHCHGIHALVLAFRTHFLVEHGDGGMGESFIRAET